jgi:hypothetical protein
MDVLGVRGETVIGTRTESCHETGNFSKRWENGEAGVGSKLRRHPASFAGWESGYKNILVSRIGRVLNEC